MKREQEILLERLVKTMKAMPPERLAQVLRKGVTVQIRVTEQEKGEMKRAASRYGLTVTDYLCRLHGLAEEIARKAGPSRIRRRRTRAGRGPA
jgi:hypothetical protein